MAGDGLINCLCGGSFKKGSKFSHCKSYNHKMFVETEGGQIFKYYRKNKGNAVQFMSSNPGKIEPIIIIKPNKISY
jgi:hypothetical protein